MSSSFAKLEDLIAALARDAVATQRRLDLAACAAQEGLARLLAKMPEDAPSEVKSLTLALAPPRMQLASFRMTCRASVEISHALGGEVRAKPINLAYQALHRSTEVEDIVLLIEVEPVPAPPPDVPSRPTE